MGPSGATADETSERAALEAELVQALRSEIGARSLYGLLARVARDPELKGVLQQLAREEQRLVVDLRTLLTELGRSTRARSWRRRAASAAIASLVPVFGMRFALRLCLDAEETVERWYARSVVRLAMLGERERAARLEAFAVAKRRHAQILRAFAQNIPGSPGTM